MRTAAILLLFLPLSAAIFSEHLSLRHRNSQTLSTAAVQKCLHDGVCAKAKFLKCRGEGVLFDQNEREACTWWPKSESQVGKNPVKRGTSDKGKCVRSPRNDITLKFHAKTERKGTIDSSKTTGYLKKTGKYEIGVIKLNRRQTGQETVKAARHVGKKMWGKCWRD